MVLLSMQLPLRLLVEHAADFQRFHVNAPKKAISDGGKDGITYCANPNRLWIISFANSLPFGFRFPITISVHDNLTNVTN